MNQHRNPTGKENKKIVNKASHDLYKPGIEQYSKKHITAENLLLIIQFILGFVGMSMFKFKFIPYISILYALFIFIMLGFVLRKHLCTHCFYYGKSCHCGWGKLSALIYRKDSGNISIASKLIGLTWGIVMVLPILIMIFAIIIGKVSFGSISIVLFLYILLVIINGITHVQDCRNCKMRFICPGSGAKKR